ncbi:biotin-dependent carboxyltransferase family protein [Pseudalkalibacillus sp. R45]|uniref:biotin-dependent carboxyltransferase family protein n=1 Tax=Pseudalkalibacillus sp. R45 TaxID=3457433 RepID=UPI003FCD5207
MKIVKPGLQTTVQDAGRYGYQRYGVIVSGAMDQLAYRIGNLLVGNSNNEAAIEMTMKGPEIEFQEDTVITMTGGDFSPKINGEPVKMWRPIYVKAGTVLKFGACAAGCRSYLAVAGGIDVPVIMNSRSTYIRAEIGGFEGRALDAGDCLKIGERSEKANHIFQQLSDPDLTYVESDWFSAAEWSTEVEKHDILRVIPGREWDSFTKESQAKLTSTEFELTPQSDRMGFRFKGEQLELSDQVEMISEAVTFGTIQVPSEGNLIALLADRQTTGGYPKIAQIASVNFSKVAQLKPGEKVRFKLITHREAETLYLEQKRHLQQLEQGISLKLREGGHNQ